MDFKLLAKIVLAQGILFLVILNVLWILNPGGVDLRIWGVLILVFSLLNYRRQSKAAKYLNISQDHPAYQQKEFNTQLTSSISPKELTQLITKSEDYLGQVKIKDEEVLKHVWKGIANMCSTSIRCQSENGRYAYEITTLPYWKYTIVDGYSGYQVHEIIIVFLGKNLS